MNNYVFLLDNIDYGEVNEFGDSVGIGHTGTSAPMTQVPELNIDINIILMVVFGICMFFGFFLAYRFGRFTAKDNEKD